jgi:hypothetical protein
MLFIQTISPGDWGCASKHNEGKRKKAKGKNEERSLRDERIKIVRNTLEPKNHPPATFRLNGRN